MNKSQDQNWERDFIEMMLEERIGMLLGRKPSDEVKEALEAAEAAVTKLPEEEQKAVERWLDMTTDMEAEDNRKLYLGGLMDGVKLARKIYASGTGEGEMPDLETLIESLINQTLCR